MQPITVAALQMTSGEDKARNLQTATRLAEEAAQRGAMFAALPELFNCLGEPAAIVAGAEPVGGAIRPFHARNVLLVGDAAGLVSPLTAGGIRPAFRYGKRAAQVIGDHLLDGGPDPGRVLAREYPRYRWKALLRRALDRDPPNWVYDWTLGLPPMRAIAQLVYFHHDGLKSRAGWRALLRGR